MTNILFSGTFNLLNTDPKAYGHSRHSGHPFHLFLVRLDGVLFDVMNQFSDDHLLERSNQMRWEYVMHMYLRVREQLTEVHEVVVVVFFWHKCITFG